MGIYTSRCLIFSPCSRGEGKHHCIGACVLSTGGPIGLLYPTVHPPIRARLFARMQKLYETVGIEYHTWRALIIIPVLSFPV